MKRNYKNEQWQRDIASFIRYKDLFDDFTLRASKEMVLKRMQDIQSRWPQYIKEDDLPKL